MTNVYLNNGMETPTGAICGANDKKHLLAELASWCDYYSHDAYMELTERPRFDDELWLCTAHPDQAHPDQSDVDWLVDELRLIMAAQLPDTHYARARVSPDDGSLIEFGIYRRPEVIDAGGFSR